MFGDKSDSAYSSIDSIKFFSERIEEIGKTRKEIKESIEFLHAYDDRLEAELEKLSEQRQRVILKESIKHFGDQWMLGEHLGSGGFGDVHKLKNKISSKSFALKIVDATADYVRNGKPQIYLN